MKLYPETKALIITLFLFFVSLFLLKYTKAYFSDTEKLLGNSIEVGVWDVTPSPSEPTNTPIPTPTPTEEPPEITITPTPVSSVAGSVVINELMWMGSTITINGSDDEWIELRNSTSQEIDLSGWQLTKWVSGTHEELMLTIPSGKVISANGFFLISNFDQVNSAISVEPNLVDSSIVLANSNLQIKLYKGIWTDSGNLIDTADDGSATPMAGTHGANEQSMERNNDPATGWHTCTDSVCNNTTYWDSEGNNYGTPKAPNI